MEQDELKLRYYKARLLWKLEECPFDDAAVSALKWLTNVTFGSREEAIKWLKIYL